MEARTERVRMIRTDEGDSLDARIERASKAASRAIEASERRQAELLALLEERDKAQGWT